MHADHYGLDAELADTHWWWVARRRVLRHLMGRLLSPEDQRKILEVGCSTGSNLAMLKDFGSVYAMELERSAAEVCRSRNPDIRVYDGGIPDPLRDRYDVICLFDVLEHIEDDAGALEWIDDHLAPGGTVLITVPAFRFLWSRHDELAHHFRRYTRRELEALLGSRFEISYTSYFNTHLFPAIAGVRLIQRLFGIDGGENDKAVASTGPANWLLKTIFAVERFWMPMIKLPFGVSIFAAARKASAA